MTNTEIKKARKKVIDKIARKIADMYTNTKEITFSEYLIAMQELGIVENPFKNI